MNEVNSIDFIPKELLRPIDWDREWMSTFRQWYGPLYFYRYDEIQPVAEIADKNPNDLYNLQLCSDQLPLWIWVKGNAILGKKVLEIGCGPGLLGKQLSFFCKEYIGIDVSPLAVNIARSVSPTNCSYYYIEEFDEIEKHRNTVDTMVCRFFFIHQNYANALWVLKLVNLLLKQNGTIGADFFHKRDGDAPRAKDDPKGNHVTSGYIYSDEELHSLANETGFNIISIEDRGDILRKFVIFSKK